MLTINGNDIAVSRGDPLSLMFRIIGYSLQAEDIFSIAFKNKCGTIISQDQSGLTGQQVYVIIPATITAQLMVGNVMYDVTVKNKDGVRTLNLPATLSILGTAHDPCGSSIVITSHCPCGMQAPAIEIMAPPDWMTLKQVVTDLQSENDKITITHGSGEQKTFTVDNVQHANRVGNLQKILRGTPYNVGDVGYREEIPSWGFLECVTGGMTSAIMPRDAPTAEGALITDGATVWVLKRAQDSELNASDMDFIFN